MGLRRPGRGRVCVFRRLRRGVGLLGSYRFQKLIQLFIRCLRPLWRGNVITAFCLVLAGLLDLRFHRGHVHRGQAEAFKDAVDFPGILRPDHDVGKTVRGIVILQHTVENAVLLGLLAEFPQLAVPDGEHLQLLAAFQHVGKPNLAAGFLLVPQNRIQQNGQSLGRLAADFSCDFHAVEAHPHDLLRRFSRIVHLPAPFARFAMHPAAPEYLRHAAGRFRRFSWIPVIF